MKFNKSYSRSICDFIDIEKKIDDTILNLTKTNLFFDLISKLNIKKKEIQKLKNQFKKNFDLSNKHPMTPEIRQMVDLYISNGYSAEEIAEILNMRKNTVKKYVESPEIKKQYLREYL